jgi:hypothetical protein
MTAHDEPSFHRDRQTRARIYRTSWLSRNAIRKFCARKIVVNQFKSLRILYVYVLSANL